MVDHVGRAVGHREHAGRDSQCYGQAVEVYEGHQQKADLWRHHHHIVQGVAHGHVAVIGHCSKRENLSHDKMYKSTQLHCTPIVGDGFLGNQEVNQHFRGNDSRVAKIDHSQLPEEEVHGGLKLRVNTGEGDDAQVPCHSQPIDDQENKEEWDLELRAV